MGKIFGWYLLVQGISGLLISLVFFVQRENLILAAIALPTSLLFIWGSWLLLRTGKRVRQKIVVDWDIGGFLFYGLPPIVVGVYAAFRLAAYNDGALLEVGPTVESKGYPVLFGAFAAFAVTGLLMVGINWVWRQIVGLIKGEPPTEPDELEDLGLTEEEDHWIQLMKHSPVQRKLQRRLTGKL